MNPSYYGDGLANASVTWGYDAAGNRTSDSSNAGTWTYDNLNRMTASPGVSYTNDILGNRLTKGSSVSYSWDALNRMISHTSGSATTSYVYRMDGMRVSKSSSSGSTVTRYDGQMTMEDVEVSGSNTTVVRHGLGARGLDYVTRTTSNGTTTLFPIYDGHGNNVAMLQRGSGGTYTVGERRSYDAWGAMRQGAQTGGSSGRYVANLGHKQDDESGLVYMMARYYEPTLGRFLNEDPGRSGTNWYVYCGNDPVNKVDKDGRNDESERELRGLSLFILGLMTMVTGIAFPDPATAVQLVAEGRLFTGLLVAEFVKQYKNDLEVARIGIYKMKDVWHGGPAFKNAMRALNKIEGAKAAVYGLAARAVIGITGYSAAIAGIGIFLGVFD